MTKTEWIAEFGNDYRRPVSGGDYRGPATAVNRSPRKDDLRFAEAALALRQLLTAATAASTGWRPNRPAPRNSRRGGPHGLPRAANVLPARLTDRLLRGGSVAVADRRPVNHIEERADVVGTP